MKAATGLLAVLLTLSCPSLAQTAPAQPASQQAPVTPAATDTVPAVPAVSAVPGFAPGATVFIEPMAGFEQRLAYAMTKKKVPVVLVKESAKADFVLSGGALVKKAGWIKGWVESAHGKGSISIQNAHTGEQVFAYKFNRADTNTTLDQIYQNWADACAKHLKKMLEKR